jgi:hypothetical protein
MDRLTAFVTIYHAMLRIEIAAFRDEKRFFSGESEMATPKLQGLAEAMRKLEHGLEAGAGKLLAKIQTVDSRGHAAIAKGHQKVDGKAALVAEIESFVTALEGANGGDPLDDSSNSSGEQQEPKQAAEDPPAGAPEPAASWGGKPA